MELICGEGGSSGQQIIQQINDNTEAIVINAEGVEANRLAIDALETDAIVVNNRLDHLEALSFYEFNSTVDTLDISNVYTTIGNLAVNILAGEYIVGMSDTYSFDTANKSVFHQFILNGGAPEEFSKENADVTDRDTFDYIFPFTMAADGLFTFQLDIRKEDTNGTLDCAHGNVWIERKA